jgi:K+-sensing histidine kinase KdpD
MKIAPISKPAEPFICLSCSSKFCEKTKLGTFEICEYGVAFVNNQNAVEKREMTVSFRELVTNLRHEIHPVLQTIIQEANKLDITLTQRKIDINKPPSTILGSTIIIDHFIQMITGVHDFHSLSDSYKSRKKINIQTSIDKYYTIYSIVKSAERAKRLSFKTNLNKELIVTTGASIIEYIISILMDNIWKYSHSDSEVHIICKEKGANLMDIEFINVSDIIPDDKEIFSKGIKCDKLTKGFGYGLYWSKILTDRYNNFFIPNAEAANLIIIHKQNILGEIAAKQTFTLKNIIINEK